VESTIASDCEQSFNKIEESSSLKVDDYAPLIMNNPGKEIVIRPNATQSVSDLSTLQSFSSNKIMLPGVSNSVTDVSQKWSSTQPNTSFKYGTTMRALDMYVKTELFHMIVFISSPAIISFLTDPQSLCQIVCNELNVSPNDQDSFWMTYAREIEYKLNQKDLMFQMP
jgi:hypothetical protein